MQIRRKSFQQSHVGLLTVLLAVSVFSQEAEASSQDLFGLSPRAMAMGGAVVSNASGYQSVYYNPSCLLRSPDIAFSVGFQRADYRLSLRDSPYPVDPVNNVIIGANVPLGFGSWLSDRLALGVGFILPSESVLTADIARPESAGFVVVENRARVVGIHMGLAVRLTEWWLLGAGAVALAELEGGMVIAPSETGDLNTSVRDELIADYAPIVGTWISPAEWLSIGFAFHGESAAEFTFPITADLGPAFPIDLPQLNVSGVAQYDPLQLSLESSFSFASGWLVSTGVAYKRWSRFENPIENTTEAMPAQDPPLFRDIYVPRIGAELHQQLERVELAYSLGGFYEPTPVPEQTGNNNYLDSDRIGFGLGTGIVWEGIHFDWALSAQFMRERRHTKDPDSVRDPENSGLPFIEHRGVIVSSSFEVGVSF